MSAEIYQQLTTVFHDVFDDESIVLRPDMTAADVDGWDSFNHIRLVVSVEQKFGVRFGSAEVGELKNVGEFVALIQRRGRAAA
jgi:acyl carrier protein